MLSRIQILFANLIKMDRLAIKEVPLINLGLNDPISPHHVKTRKPYQPGEIPLAKSQEKTLKGKI